MMTIAKLHRLLNRRRNSTTPPAAQTRLTGRPTKKPRCTHTFFLISFLSLRFFLSTFSFACASDTFFASSETFFASTSTLDRLMTASHSPEVSPSVTFRFDPDAEEKARDAASLTFGAGAEDEARGSRADAAFAGKG